jgi:hypothetical protein
MLGRSWTSIMMAFGTMELKHEFGQKQQTVRMALAIAHSGASGHLNRSIRPPLFSGCEA